jgi:hypothetical protein
VSDLIDVLVLFIAASSNILCWPLFKRNYLINQECNFYREREKKKDSCDFENPSSFFCEIFKFLIIKMCDHSLFSAVFFRR